MIDWSTDRLIDRSICRFSANLLCFTLLLLAMVVDTVIAGRSWGRFPMWSCKGLWDYGTMGTAICARTRPCSCWSDGGSHHRHPTEWSRIRPQVMIFQWSPAHSPWSNIDRRIDLGAIHKLLQTTTGPNFPPVFWPSVKHTQNIPKTCKIHQIAIKKSLNNYNQMYLCEIQWY